ncbi:Fc.00g093260.m01.CDS01 [Cosmosporella sp. VM-42]
MEAGFRRVPLEKRLAATTPLGRLTNGDFSISEEAMNDGWTFPGPLVAANDALALDPKEPAQTLRSWLPLNGETPVTSRRKTIYVIPSPEMTKEAKTLMQDWENPRVPTESAVHLPAEIPVPEMDHLCDYLRAFYHKMDVKQYDNKFLWQPWTSRPRTTDTGYIGLVSRKEMSRVRYRPSPDGIARRQLNLSDILDVLLDHVPSDAYAIVMLVDQDLYEDEEDDFCCGRADGGSRIAVVSGFRYHPTLDNFSEIELEHMWPASHCKSYMDKQCAQTKRPAKRAKTETSKLTSSPDSPLGAAILASKDTLKPKTKEDFAGLWFSRTARTLSHEVGHCFRLGHCIFFSCALQGTASVAEDVRQPPYLCPVCLAKLSMALAPLVGRGAILGLQKTYIKERYQALSSFCERWNHIGMFSGWQAFVDKRLEQGE